MKLTTSTMGSKTRQNHPPCTIHHYNIEASISGDNELAATYLATDLKLGELICLKFLSYPTTSQSVARFRREVALLKTLEHGNVVKFLSGFLHTSSLRIPSNISFLPRAAVTMELCDGNLRQKLKMRGEIDRYWNLWTFRQILLGLAYLHSNGIMHGDLKPSNVLFKGGVPKLNGFGLSEDDGSLVVGLSGYAPPEARFRGKYTELSDAYSLGIIFIELFTAYEEFWNWMKRAGFSLYRSNNPFTKLPRHTELLSISRDLLPHAFELWREYPSKRITPDVLFTKLKFNCNCYTNF